ncbi:hypothetical protein [uncultured Propionibacterium sp.]|uniref:hypothetical protein n=1 Tax=uncultured Propionibacterium sp. TaxID=218066 RepID=UPI00292FC0AD|nr:hypothetical protein [uncultured Propionibacterium sp.]
MKERLPAPLTRAGAAGALLIGFLAGAAPGAALRDERGLSQSTENAVLLAGAVVVAGIVVAAVRAYVTAHMPS